MDFFYNPKPIDKTISELKRKFRTMMNGEISGSMNAKGAKYRVNYGVEYPRLKELALKYEPSSDLAGRLWKLNIRESMILATLLQPAADFTREDAENWSKDVNQPELVEYLCMNLFSKVDFSSDLIKEWIGSVDIWKQITAFTLLARVYHDVGDELVDLLIERIEKLSETDNFHLYKSISLGLSRICRRNVSTARKIEEKVKDFELSESISKRYLFNEVSMEIESFFFV